MFSDHTKLNFFVFFSFRTVQFTPSELKTYNILIITNHIVTLQNLKYVEEIILYINQF